MGHDFGVRNSRESIVIYEFLKMIRLLLLMIILIKFCENNSNSIDENDEQLLNLTNKKNIEHYFQLKRRQHSIAIQTLYKYNDRYEQQYSMIVKLFQNIFNVIDDCKQFIDDKKLDYNLINDEFIETLSNDNDSDNKLKLIEIIIKIIDNCAFFANIVLKLPDISQRILSKNNWKQTYRWCFNFTINTNLIDDLSAKLFNLASQQLNIIEKDEDFYNPYEKKNKILKQQQLDDKNKNKNSKRKFERKKGPRMTSRIEL